jgi:hypothetical protein
MQEVRAIIHNQQDMLKRNIPRIHGLVHHAPMSSEANAQWCAQQKQAKKLMSTLSAM